MTEPEPDPPEVSPPIEEVVLPEMPRGYPIHEFSPDHTADGGEADICYALLKTATFEKDGYEMEIQCGLVRAQHPFIEQLPEGEK